MSKHNYSQYSNKNYKPKVEESVVENVMISKPETMTVEPSETMSVVNIEPMVETVETVALPEIITGTVANCSKLNVRSKPSIDAEVLAILNSDSEIVIDPAGSTSEWLKITTAAGIDGYCMRKFVNAKL